MVYLLQVVEKVKKMRQGPALGQGVVDCGAMCMPGLAEKVAELVDDAVLHGAKVGLCPKSMQGLMIRDLAHILHSWLMMQLHKAQRYAYAPRSMQGLMNSAFNAKRKPNTIGWIDTL